MRPMLTEIQQAVCQWYGMPRNDMLSTSRVREIARPRQVFMYLAREMTVLSLPQIAKSLGGMDHTTVLHGIRNIERLMRTIPELERDVRMSRQLAIHIASKRSQLFRQAA